MATTKQSAEIAASPQAVYDVISDPTRLRDWDVTYESATPIRLDHRGESTFHADRSWANRGMHLTCQVTATNPGTSFAFACEGDDGEVVRESFDLAPAGRGGTRFTRELEIELPGQDLGVVAETTFAEAWTDRLVEQAFARLAARLGPTPAAATTARPAEAESRTEDSGPVSGTEPYSAHTDADNAPPRPT